MSAPRSAIPRLGLRRVLRCAAVAGVFLLAFTVRVVTSSASELSMADELLAQGQEAAAVVHYRRAARWYAPFSPFHGEALRKLATIAAAAERGGDVELALSAHRAIRAAILSTRSFYVPERERLEQADRRIADLMAAQPPPPMDADKSREQIRREHLALLSARPGPNLGWTLVLLAGFAIWVLGAFTFSMRAIDVEDRIIREEALRWGTVVVVGFGCFVLGMALA